MYCTRTDARKAALQKNTPTRTIESKDKEITSPLYSFNSSKSARGEASCDVVGGVVGARSSAVIMTGFESEIPTAAGNKIRCRA